MSVAPPACAGGQLQLSSERVSTGSRRRLVSASHRTQDPLARPHQNRARLAPRAALPVSPGCEPIRLAPSWSNFRPGLLDRPAACAAFRSFGSRPGGELRLAPSFLPSAPSGWQPPSFRPQAFACRPSLKGPSSGWACDKLSSFTRTFTRRLAPLASFRLPPCRSSPELRQRFNIPARTGVAFLWPCQRCMVRLSPRPVPSGVRGGRCFSGFHRPACPPLTPAIPFRFPTGSSVGETVRPLNL